jgi:uncharacterized coiled-coil protein SlyX
MKIGNYEIKINKIEKFTLKERLANLESMVSELDDVVDALNTALANNLGQLQRMTVIVDKLTNGNN